uniref:Uncharacterized protein n=1 Tax=Pristionchus pacificus TaxID=54126 RepID=A0A2A6CGS1_PRIPA|eukprot:PDM77263.1 hypothetical protein PRIPAC_43175 [Pristionchus pacificus]
MHQACITKAATATALPYLQQLQHRSCSFSRAVMTLTDEQGKQDEEERKRKEEKYQWRRGTRESEKIQSYRWEKEERERRQRWNRDGRKKSIVESSDLPEQVLTRNCSGYSGDSIAIKIPRVLKRTTKEFGCDALTAKGGKMVAIIQCQISDTVHVML